MAKRVVALTNWFGSARQTKKGQTRSFKPRLEPLEDRNLLAVTFTVDDNFVDNPALFQYNTIQEAVSAAAAGDTIKVNPGSYEENVVVDKKLTIQAKPATPSNATNPSVAAIVDPVDDGVSAVPAYGFDLRANDIVIQGFTIGEFDNVTDPDGTVGIKTSASYSGYKILTNTIKDNVFGIYLNTDTSATAHTSQVSGNTIRDNNVGFLTLPSSGNGIYSDQGARNVQITLNNFMGHKNEDVIFVAPSALQANLTIQSNAFRTSSGVFFINVTNSKITTNLIDHSAYNGIELAGGNSNITIQTNILNFPGTQGYNGIFLNNSAEVGPNTNVKILSNLVVNAGLSGIVIRDSNVNTVQGNVIVGSKGFDLSNPTWGSGISLENAQNNTISSNIVTLNRANGIRVDASSAGNTIKSNTAFANGNVNNSPPTYDYYDESTGSGTAGTANTYQTNKGRTQNRTGLIQTFI